MLLCKYGYVWHDAVHIEVQSGALESGGGRFTLPLFLPPSLIQVLGWVPNPLDLVPSP